MSDVVIRPATTDDVPAIIRIGEAAWNEAYGEILSQETIDTAIEEWYQGETTREAIQQDETGYFVAEQNGDVIGYVSGGPAEKDDVAVLATIYVDPPYWNQRAGTALLERFETFCKKRNYEAIQLRVLADNEIGRSFYRTHGYEHVETCETDLFGESVRECLFCRQIG